MDDLRRYPEKRELSKENGRYPGRTEDILRYTERRELSEENERYPKTSGVILRNRGLSGDTGG
jgi:hypothetical protein